MERAISSAGDARSDVVVRQPREVPFFRHSANGAGEFPEICGADLPVAQTMKMRLNFCSYSRLPAARAALISSPAAPTFCCSALDQAADWTGADAGACESPILGWLRKASSQSDSGRFVQTSSDAVNKAASLRIGLRAAISRAQAFEPQQGKISSAALSGCMTVPLSEHFCSVFAPHAVSVQLLQKSPDQIRRYGGAIARGGTNVVDGPDFSGCGRSCQPDELRIDRFSLYDSFRLAQSKRDGCDTSHRKTNIVDNATCQDVLSPPSTSLAIACALRAPTLRA